MHTIRILVVAAALLAIVAATPVVTARPPLTPETLDDADVRLAIDTIVDELIRRKRPDTFWDPAVWVKRDDGEPSQGGGYTALVALALLQAGESYQSTRLRDAIEHLKTAELRGTYAIATRALVWARLPDAFRPQLEADTQWLLDAFSRKTGGWEYESRPNSARLDNSATLFGVLALAAAAERGIEIKDKVWQRIETRFLESQTRKGGWSYRPPDPDATGSMTTAGLTALHLTLDHLHGDEFVTIRRKPIELPAQRALDAAIAWLEAAFTVERNPGLAAYDFYYLWGVERVALAGGHRAFRQLDWYRHGASTIIDRLLVHDADAGTMTVRPLVNDEYGDTPVRNDTLAFSLLFLSRGRVPIAVNKLRIPGMAWNNRPGDVPHFVRWLGRESEQELNWQIVDFDDRPEDWLDAAFVYVASNQPLPWIDSRTRDLQKYVRESRRLLEQRATGEVAIDHEPPLRPDVPELDTLRRAIDLGACVVAIAENKSRSFARSVELAGEVMYPHLAWRDLPEDHWAWSLVWPTDGRRPRLRGLSNGVRELMILADRDDIASVLQARDRSPRQEPSWAALANVYFHGSEKNRLRPRLHRMPPLEAPTRTDAAAGVIVRAVHRGRWKPEPLALERFRPWFTRIDGGPGFSIVDAPLSSVGTLIPRPMLVTVHGIDALEFSDDERTAIETYVRAGGVILFETPGGVGEFTVSAEDQVGPLFGQTPGPLLESRVITGTDLPGAANVRSVTYRPFALETFGARETLPRLRGIEVDGQPRVLFSREDLSFGWLDLPRWGVVGYRPEDARRLFGNIVRHAFAVQARSAPAPAPAPTP